MVSIIVDATFDIDIYQFIAEGDSIPINWSHRGVKMFSSAPVLDELVPKEKFEEIHVSAEFLAVSLERQQLVHNRKRRCRPGFMLQ